MAGNQSAVSRGRLVLLAGLFFALVGACGQDQEFSTVVSGRRIDPEPRTGARSADCDAMSAKLRWDYETVRTCARDEDCNYVDGFYSIIPREQAGRFVTTVACGVRTPFLIVANGSRLASRLEEVSAHRTMQAEACADPSLFETETDECRTQSGFDSSSPPVCRGGTCQAVRGSDYYGVPTG